MKAKSKPIKKITPQELNVEMRSDMEVIEVTDPPKRKAGVILSSVDELLDKLKNEAHVIWTQIQIQIHSNQNLSSNSSL